MSANVYSLRIFGHGGLSPAGGEVGPVVPAGFIWVVRCIDVVEPTGTRPASLFVFNANLGLLWSVNSPAGDVTGHYQWQGRQVYAEGEKIGFQSGSGTWSVSCSGYQLTLP